MKTFKCRCRYPVRFTWQVCIATAGSIPLQPARPDRGLSSGLGQPAVRARERSRVVDVRIAVRKRHDPCVNNSPTECSALSYPVDYLYSPGETGIVLAPLDDIQ
jgi:hypothetical protein